MKHMATQNDAICQVSYDGVLSSSGSLHNCKYSLQYLPRCWASYSFGGTYPWIYRCPSSQPLGCHVRFPLVYLAELITNIGGWWRSNHFNVLYIAIIALYQWYCTYSVYMCNGHDNYIVIHILLTIVWTAALCNGSIALRTIPYQIISNFHRNEVYEYICHTKVIHTNSWAST